MTTKLKPEEILNDDFGVKIFTLPNGLKLYLSPNNIEPRIQTFIAVKAGSKMDPEDNTGLAHYLEHMMFKGTENIGTLNWKKEEILLTKISDLFEIHKKEKNPESRKKIYSEIDDISFEASKLVATNEYDKLLSSIGAKGTNAFTSVEQTVYINDIPSNELEKWMIIESERFKSVVLRLFHTELEAVYEEFNIGQDMDGRKSNRAISKLLFPNHPYGTQTIIGTSDHLKNPSMVKIKEYFNKYYVPNNMAIIASGDFDVNHFVKLAEKYFGDYLKTDLDEFTFENQPESKKIQRTTVFGNEGEYVDIAWRLNGANSKDAQISSLIANILYNHKAGLIDINLVQNQKLLEADSWMWNFKDYTTFGLYGKPLEGQSLEEVEALLLNEIDRIKKGEFEEWLVPAVIKNLKLKRMKSLERNQDRAFTILNSYVNGIPWSDIVNKFDKLEKITKQEIIDFAKHQFKDNYAVVYKKTGIDNSVVKVDKPKITPIQVNREGNSMFYSNLQQLKSKEIIPKFMNFDSDISSVKINKNIKLDYIKNEINNTFSLYYIIEMGKNSNPRIPLAIDYLKYLGTNKYSPDELKKEFFKLGLDYGVFSSENQTYVFLNGLEESLEKGLQLFEHFLSSIKPDSKALENLIKSILKRRTDNKKDKRLILNKGLFNYAKYGKKSSFNDVLSESELNSISANSLTDIIKNLTSFEHHIFYYGTKQIDLVKKIISKFHETPKTPISLIKEKHYPEISTTKNNVYFVDFPTIQTEILMVSKVEDKYNFEINLWAQLYNEYFGHGLSSIVFQEIRESQALAYSTYAFLGLPHRKRDGHHFRAYVGTQPDKIAQAIPALLSIINDMPVSKMQFENARKGIIKKISTDRISGKDIYFNYQKNQKLGIEEDTRIAIYKQMQKINIEDLKKFQENLIKNQKYSIMVLGSKKDINFDYLKTLGPITELSIEDVLGY